MLNKNKDIVVFDVCGTLFHSNTTFDFLDYLLKDNRKYLFFKRLTKNKFVKIINHVIFKILHKDFIREYATKFLNGYSKRDLERHSIIFYDGYLSKCKIEKVMDLLDKYKNNSEDVILVSASYDFLIKTIANKLELRYYLASKLEVNDGIYTGKYVEDFLGNKKKYLFKYVGSNILLDVITDNKSDTDLIDIAKNAIIISKKKNVHFWKKRGGKYEIWEI